MSERFKNKYRIPSARAGWWNYSNEGAYFITICTRKHQHFFGKIIDGQMQLSAAGLIAQKNWNEIPKHFSFITLDSFVVMPNHVHGILIIDLSKNRKFLANPSGNSITNELKYPTDKIDDFIFSEIPTNVSSANVKDHALIMADISPKEGSLGSIIRSYKSAVTREVRKLLPYFDWQPRFHDHIIRNDKSFKNISDYIISNPLKWNDDRFNVGQP